MMCDGIALVASGVDMCVFKLRFHFQGVIVVTAQRGLTPKSLSPAGVGLLALSLVSLVTHGLFYTFTLIGA